MMQDFFVTNTFWRFLTGADLRAENFWLGTLSPKVMGMIFDKRKTPHTFIAKYGRSEQSCVVETCLESAASSYFHIDKTNLGKSALVVKFFCFNWKHRLEWFSAILCTVWPIIQWDSSLQLCWQLVFISCLSQVMWWMYIITWTKAWAILPTVFNPAKETTISSANGIVQETWIYFMISYKTIPKSFGDRITIWKQTSTTMIPTTTHPASSDDDIWQLLTTTIYSLYLSRIYINGYTMDIRYLIYAHFLSIWPWQTLKVNE